MDFGLIDALPNPVKFKEVLKSINQTSQKKMEITLELNFVSKFM